MRVAATTPASISARRPASVGGRAPAPGVNGFRAGSIVRRSAGRADRGFASPYRASAQTMEPTTVRPGARTARESALMA